MGFGQKPKNLSESAILHPAQGLHAGTRQYFLLGTCGIGSPGGMGCYGEGCGCPLGWMRLLLPAAQAIFVLSPSASVLFLDAGKQTPSSQEPS